MKLSRENWKLFLSTSSKFQTVPWPDPKIQRDLTAVSRAQYPKTRRTQQNDETNTVGRMMGRMKLGVKQPGKFYRAKEQSVRWTRVEWREAPRMPFSGGMVGRTGVGGGESAERFVPSVN